MRSVWFSLLALLMAGLFAVTPATAAARPTQAVTAQMQGWINYGPEADGYSLLLLTKEGQYMVVGMGSADRPELQKLKVGDMLSLRVYASQEQNDVLGIPEQYYFYVDESGKILPRR